MDEIVSHYSEIDLYDSIISAIGRAGIDLDQVTTDDLGPVDEFHIGGREATGALIDLAGIPTGSRVLDVGSGVGGTARYLAEVGRHSVTGIDLTPEFVTAATALTAMVGLDGSVEFHVADVCDLPFSTASFDAAVLLHVGMNLPDKARAFAEVARVLVDGGVFAIYDIMGDKDAGVDFPLPWAASPSASFLATSDEYVESLEANGFEVLQVADRSDYAKQFFANMRQRKDPPPPVGLHLLMGEGASARYGNMVKAVEAGAIAPTKIIATTRGTGASASDASR